MNDRPNILVVCGKNKRRSRTADYLFKNNGRFAIRSVGLSPKSNRKISEKDIQWAHLIFVMTPPQKDMISGTYRHMDLASIEILNIDDEYEYLDNSLIELLHDRINSTLSLVYNI